MGVITKFCNGYKTTTATSESYLAEFTLYVEVLKDLYDIIYEDESYILFGCECKGIATIKAFKNSCNCTQFEKIIEGDFSSEIPVINEGLDLELDFQLG